MSKFTVNLRIPFIQKQKTIGHVNKNFKKKHINGRTLHHGGS